MRPKSFGLHNDVHITQTITLTLIYIILSSITRPFVLCVEMKKKQGMSRHVFISLKRMHVFCTYSYIECMRIVRVASFVVLALLFHPNTHTHMMYESKQHNVKHIVSNLQQLQEKSVPTNNKKRSNTGILLI